MSVSGLSDCVSKRYVHVSVKGVILCQSVSVMEYVSVSIRGINTCQSKSCVCVSQGYKSVSVCVSQCQSVSVIRVVVVLVVVAVAASSLRLARGCLKNQSINTWKS